MRQTICGVSTELCFGNRMPTKPSTTECRHDGIGISSTAENPARQSRNQPQPRMTRITRIRTQMAVPFPSVSIREIRGQKSSHFAQIFIDSSTEEKNHLGR